MSQQDDLPEDDSDFQELEKKLLGLKPQAPSENFSRRMGHRLEALERNQAEDKVVWVRFAPVAAAACVVLTSAFLFRDHLLEQQKVAETGKGNEIDSATVPVVAPPAPAPVFNDASPAPVRGFQPVSEATIFQGATDAGIIRVGGGDEAVRRVRLQGENARHLYDPSTETNLRIFSPVEEDILVPVETD